MNLDFSYDADKITLRAPKSRAGLLGRLISRTGPPDLANAEGIERSLVFAVADLRAAAEEQPPGSLVVDTDHVCLSHGLASQLDGDTASTLGLPPLVDLVLRTDAEGQIRSPSFRLRYEWAKHGRRQRTRRVGAILQTADGVRRLPAFIVDAIEVADALESSGDETVHWEALARFRQALDGRPDPAGDGNAVAMTRFLEGLEVHLADRFSLAPVDRPDGLDFDVVPFSGRKLDERIVEEPAAEADAELSGRALSVFQARFRERGALNAYLVEPSRYLVVDRAAQPALRVMAAKQRATPDERAAFVRNPWPAVTEAVEVDLRSSGRLTGLTPTGEQEAVEAACEPVLVETKEYAERVIGRTVFEAPDLNLPEAAETTWMPEDFDDATVERLREMDEEELATICDDVEQAIESGSETVEVAGTTVPATQDTLRAITSVRPNSMPCQLGDVQQRRVLLPYRIEGCVSNRRSGRAWR